MPGTQFIPPVGSEEPLTPTHTLPAYDEPTPETHGRMSREKEAELALLHTAFAPGARFLLISLFILTILVVPAIQFTTELHQPHSDGELPTFKLFKLLPSAAKLKAAHTLASMDSLIPHAGDFKAAEKTLENESVVSQWLLPRVQSVLSGVFDIGNEQVITGRNGWLFYRPDVEYVTGPPFLDPVRMRQRAHAAGVQPDPLTAIVEFRDQLAKRGIDLIVMPVPVKPSIDGEMLCARASHAGALQNPSFDEFKARLKRQSIRVFDPEPLLSQRKGTQPLYLEADTHWRPETMEFIAGKLASFMEGGSPAQRQAYQLIEKKIESSGDIATMLKLPPGQRIYKPQTVAIRQVTVRNALWRQSKESSLLLMGDSFCNIFSLTSMGWGESAGFAEHLSRALGQPIDCILRNSDGAFATREILSRELARGRDRLAGKKQVVWEFSTRELAFGNWKPIEMTLGTARQAHFFTPKPGECVKVTGVVEAASLAPQQGSVPYKDHILTVHLVDMEIVGTPPAGEGDPVESLVYLWSMRDNTWTKAARLRPGDQITVRLQAWQEVSAQYETINRSELDDEALQLEEPVWGELEY